MILSTMQMLCVCVFLRVRTQAQLCLTVCNPMDHNLPGSSVHGVLQARTLEWVAISYSRGSSPVRDQNDVSVSSALAGRFFTSSATWAALRQILIFLKYSLFF